MASYFAVTRERGPAWNWALPMRRQIDWDAHAAFMDELVAGGVIVAGGPLGDEDTAPRVMLIFRAESKEAVEVRLADDPWTPSKMLVTVGIEPWNVLLGGFAWPP